MASFGNVDGCTHADGRPKTFAELEEEGIEAADVFSAVTLALRTGRRELPTMRAAVRSASGRGSGFLTRSSEIAPDGPR